MVKSKLNIGNKIKYFMKRINMTGIQLAEELNVTPGTVSNWINNRRDPSWENIQQLAKVFDIDLYELVDVNLEAIDNLDKKSLRIFDKITNSKLSHNKMISIVSPFYDLIARTNNSTLFGLIMNDMSMDRIIKKDDIVLFDVEEEYKHNDLVIVLINQEEATVRRYYDLDDKVSFGIESSQKNIDMIRLFNKNENYVILGKVLLTFSTLGNKLYGS